MNTEAKWDAFKSIVSPLHRGDFETYVDVLRRLRDAGLFNPFSASVAMRRFGRLTSGEESQRIVALGLPSLVDAYDRPAAGG